METPGTTASAERESLSGSVAEHSAGSRGRSRGTAHVYSLRGETPHKPGDKAALNPTVLKQF